MIYSTKERVRVYALESYGSWIMDKITPAARLRMVQISKNLNQKPSPSLYAVWFNTSIIHWKKHVWFWGSLLCIILEGNDFVTSSLILTKISQSALDLALFCPTIPCAFRSQISWKKVENLNLCHLHIKCNNHPTKILEWLEGVGRSKLVHAEKISKLSGLKSLSDWPVTPFVHPGHRPVPGRGYASGHLGDQRKTKRQGTKLLGFPDLKAFWILK